MRRKYFDTACAGINIKLIYEDISAINLSNNHSEISNTFSSTYFTEGETFLLTIIKRYLSRNMNILKHV